MKGGKARSKIMKSQASQILVHYTTFIQKIGNYLTREKEYIGKFVSKNVSWEVQKALAIQMMMSSMT